jgi:hypothetical protein
LLSTHPSAGSFERRSEVLRQWRSGNPLLIGCRGLRGDSVVGQARLHSDPLDLLLPQPIGFHQLCLKFLLHGQRNFQCDWVHQLDQELTDGSVDLPARNLVIRNRRAPTSRCGAVDNSSQRQDRALAQVTEKRVHSAGNTAVAGRCAASGRGLRGALQQRPPERCHRLHHAEGHAGGPSAGDPRGT